MLLGCVLGLAACSGTTTKRADVGTADPPGPTSDPERIDGQPQTTDPEPPVEEFATAHSDQAAYAREYAANWGYDRIGARAMHARGGTGAGVVIGIADVDASPNHRELTGKYEVVAEHEKRWTGTAHGGAVGAIMVARRDGHGMHGIAYDARLASIAGHGSAAQKFEWLNNVRPDVKLVNSSIGGAFSPDTGTFFAGARLFVARGGVIVYATGNQRARHPELTAAAPDYDSALERGWLAVASLSEIGRFADHADRCGRAARWCLTAPGMNITTIDGDTTDGYVQRYGTSYAAPMVSAGIAGLKSLFPNLSFQQLRVRVLHSADRTEPYDNETVYGQGVLDLDAASRPIGGLHLPAGPNAAGPVHRATHAHATVASHYATTLADANTLMLDGYQRAPFTVKLNTMVRRRSALLTLDDTRFESERATPRTEGVEVRWERTGTGATLGPYALAGDGAVVHARLATRGATIKLSASAQGKEGTGATQGVGIGRWSPRHALRAELGTGAGAQSLAITYAGGLAHPGGLAGRGALRARGAATSVHYRTRRALTRNAQIVIEGTLAHVARRGTSTLVNADDAWVARAGAHATFGLDKDTKAYAEVGLERPIGTTRTTIRMAQSVDEDGALRYRRITIDDGALATLATARVGVTRRLHGGTHIGAGMAWAEDGGGTRDAIAAVRATLRF